MEPRLYSIEIKDLETEVPVLLTIAHWTAGERRLAIVQMMRLAGLQDETYIIGETGPE